MRSQMSKHRRHWKIFKKMCRDLDIICWLTPATRKIESMLAENSFQTMESVESRISAEYLRVNLLRDWKQLWTGVYKESTQRTFKFVQRLNCADKTCLLQSRCAGRPWPRSGQRLGQHNARLWITNINTKRSVVNRKIIIFSIDSINFGLRTKALTDT